MSNKRSNAGNGPSQRQLRVGELIRRTLSDVLNRAEIHDPDLNRMSITVGEVSMSNDLKVATVYVMPLMGSVPVEDAIAALARNKNEPRRLFSDPIVQRDLAAPDADDEDGEDA